MAIIAPGGLAHRPIKVPSSELTCPPLLHLQSPAPHNLQDLTHQPVSKYVLSVKCPDLC